MFSVNKTKITEDGCFMYLKVNGVFTCRKCEIQDDVITPVVSDKELLLEAHDTGFEIIRR